MSILDTITLSEDQLYYLRNNNPWDNKSDEWIKKQELIFKRQNLINKLFDTSFEVAPGHERYRLGTTKYKLRSGVLTDEIIEHLLACVGGCCFVNTVSSTEVHLSQVVDTRW